LKKRKRKQLSLNIRKMRIKSLKKHLKLSKKKKKRHQRLMMLKKKNPQRSKSQRRTSFKHLKRSLKLRLKNESG